MITSILDTDLYKFTTSYAYMRMFPLAQGKFKFYDRAKKTIVTDEMLSDITQKISNLAMLKLTDSEMHFMCDKCRFIPPYYWKWLKAFRYDTRTLSIWKDENNYLQIEVSGLLHEITLWEVPILAVVSEVFTAAKGNVHLADAKSILLNNLDSLDPNVKFSEFGTRRRASKNIQDGVIRTLMEQVPNQLTGTSNCHFAHLYGLKPMGTHPHEWFMFHGAMYGYEHANYMALENWINTYDGDLGIALTDTYTTDVFYRNFSKKHSKLFDGVRHDSSDPFVFGWKTIDHYDRQNINPKSKTIIFSDGLDFVRASQIYKRLDNNINTAFGIGTFLTNNIGLPPANVVMKLDSCKMTPWQVSKPCIKLSDVEGKHTGNPDEVALAKMILNV